MTDIRWKQRFSNFLKAFRTLEDAVNLSNERPLSTLEQQGLIQGFEFTHELAWNVLKDYVEHIGIIGVNGSIGATRAAFKEGVIEDGEVWMEMVKTRNSTVHSYDEDNAAKSSKAIIQLYFPAFKKLVKTLTARYDAEDLGE